MRLIAITILCLFAVSHMDAQSAFSSENITTNNIQNLTEIGIIGRGTANDIDWHPDGKTLAVASSTGVWLLSEDLETISETAIKQPISDVEWSPDGSFLAVASSFKERCTIQIWDADLTAPLIVIDRCNSPIRWNDEGAYLAAFNPSISPFRSVFLSANADFEEVITVNIETHEVSKFPGDDGVWSPSGNTLFTRLPSTAIYTWDVDTKEELSTLEVTDVWYATLVHSLDESTVLVRCSETDEESDRVAVGVCILDVYTGELGSIQEWTSYYQGWGNWLTDFLPNSDKTLFSYISRKFDDIYLTSMREMFLGLVFVQDTITNESLYIGNGQAVDWRTEDNVIGVIVGNGEIRTYNATTGEEIAQSRWFTAPINMIDLRPNSTQITSAGYGYEQYTNIWDMDDSMTDPLLSYSTEITEIVDYTPDGNELITGGTIITDIIVNQNIGAFDADTGERQRGIAGFYSQSESPPRRYWNSDYTEYAEVDDTGLVHLPDDIVIDTDREIKNIFWSPDDSMIAIIEGRRDDIQNTITTWYVKTGAYINSFSSSIMSIHTLHWSPTGNQIAVEFDIEIGANSWVYRGLQFFNVVSGEDYLLKGDDFQTLGKVSRYNVIGQPQFAWNSDGTMFAIAVNDRLLIYELQNRKDNPIVSLPVYNIVDLKWSADGNLIAGGSADGTIRLWGIPEENN